MKGDVQELTVKQSGSEVCICGESVRNVLGPNEIYFLFRQRVRRVGIKLFLVKK